MDSMNSPDTIYGISTNDIKFISYKEELFKEDLKIKNGEEKDISIKFSNGYSETITLKTIVFEDIILNVNKDQSDRISFNIDI